MFIIICGNVVDGFNFIGPFKDIEEASAHANLDAHLRDHDWYTAPLEKPDEEAAEAG